MKSANPYQVAAYVDCPRKAWLDWYAPRSKPSPADVLIENTIKSAYLYEARKGIIPTWKTVCRWAVIGISKLNSSSNEKEDYRDNKLVLSKLSNWYNKYLSLNQCDQGIINVPIKLTLDYTFTFEDTIPIVSIGKQVRLYDFRHIGKPSIYQVKNIYNSLEVQSRIWGFWKATNILPVEYVWLINGPNTIKPLNYLISLDRMHRLEVYIRQALRGIRDNAFYCSFSKQCKLCPHVSACEL
jgi:hypothetical protein